MGSIIIGIVAIRVEAIPTFAYSIAIRLPVIPNTGPNKVPINITLVE